LTQVKDTSPSVTNSYFATGTSVGVANAYTPAGDLWQCQLGNNLWETRSFDPLLRWTGVSLGATKGGAERFQTGLTYYKNDNPKTQAITDTVTGAPLARVQNYTYDPANRISAVAEDTAWQRTFGYDRWANAYVSPDTTKSYGLTVSSFTPNSTLWLRSRLRIGPLRASNLAHPGIAIVPHLADACSAISAGAS
jgi:hypothetical protein